MADNRDCEGASSCSRESCEGCPSAKGAQSLQEKLNEFSKIGHVIGVVSGKGGVGKSLVTASLANLMAEMGYKVGIMDADVTGPSIPKMYGLSKRIIADNRGMIPAVTKNNIKVVSLNLLVPDPEQAVIWRGPVIAGVVKQFWTDVVWGDLDYLFVDMPPGTGDVPLTVFQSLPVDGILVVTSPQDLVSLIVKKALNMAHMMNIPALGIIENYSYLICPDCGKKIHVFGESHLKDTVTSFGVPVAGYMPIDPKLAEASDAGTFADVKNDYLESAAQIIKSVLG